MKNPMIWIQVFRVESETSESFEFLGVKPISKPNKDNHFLGHSEPVWYLYPLDIESFINNISFYNVIILETVKGNLEISECTESKLIPIITTPDIIWNYMYNEPWIELSNTKNTLIKRLIHTALIINKGASMERVEKRALEMTKKKIIYWETHKYNTDNEAITTETTNTGHNHAEVDNSHFDEQLQWLPRPSFQRTERMVFTNDSWATDEDFLNGR